MAAKEIVRPGGRSARVQECVHRAVQALLAEGHREDLTVPQVAARAGVTPSTIYRRWGDLPALLADVAVQRLRPDTGPRDTGALCSDLQAWAEQYQEEMSSEPGHAMMRDVLASHAERRPASKCAALVRAQLELIRERALVRGETPPGIDTLMDRIVAPIVYRLLFDDTPMEDGYASALVATVLGEGGVSDHARHAA